MIQPLALRAEAENLASPLPPLLAEAEHLASTVLLGDHGRRRPGLGDTFWQYRPAQSHDAARAIDWRRSARSDAAFVQDKEWQIAQSVILWVDQAASMRFASDDALPTKSHRARLLALASAILLNRGGERVGLTGLRLPPRRGAAQLARMAALLSEDDPADYGNPDAQGMLPHSRALFVSDFLGDPAPVEAAPAHMDFSWSSVTSGSRPTTTGTLELACRPIRAPSTGKKASLLRSGLPSPDRSNTSSPTLFEAK